MGASSILVIGIVGGLFAATFAALVLGSVAAAGQRARLAADLAAIAAATSARDGAPARAACAVGMRVARGNGARLESCSWTGPIVSVVAVVKAPVWPQPARARSRAGPEPGVAAQQSLRIDGVSGHRRVAQDRDKHGLEEAVDRLGRHEAVDDEA
jgi:secretion/DNA translocation related TadE-like protein